MIILRRLAKKDAPMMLEWMHDIDVQKGLKRRMLDASIEDVTEFINKAVISDTIKTGDNIHYAIADKQNNEYMGTISDCCERILFIR